MTPRFARPEEIANWNNAILANPDGGNVFQGAEFAEQKQSGGWAPRYVMLGDIAVTVLEKRIIGLGKLWYLPKGPGVTSARQLSDLAPLLRTFAARHGVFLVKIEPELLDEPQTRSELLQLGFTKTQAIQPNVNTVTVDISDDIDAVLANLNQKGRHAIRRAERDGVTIQRVDTSDENCRIMYDLLAGTAAGSFRIRSFDYYRAFWQRYSANETGQLFFARFEDKIVAGAYAMVLGEKSTYKDGASIKERTAYGASHLLQWEVIQWAKEHGSLVHDLCGTPPSHAVKDASHPHYGLGRFKTSFNKHVTDYIGAWDLPISPLRYKLWITLGQRIVLRLHNLRHHESWW